MQKLKYNHVRNLITAMSNFCLMRQNRRVFNYTNIHDFTTSYMEYFMDICIPHEVFLLSDHPVSFAFELYFSENKKICFIVMPVQILLKARSSSICAFNRSAFRFSYILRITLYSRDIVDDPLPYRKVSIAFLHFESSPDKSRILLFAVRGNFQYHTLTRTNFNNVNLSYTLFKF